MPTSNFCEDCNEEHSEKGCLKKSRNYSSNSFEILTPIHMAHVNENFNLFFF